MKKIIIMLLFFAAQTSIYAQYQITVLDKTTNQPLGYVNIYYPDTKTGTITDEKGIFRLQTQNKSVFIQVSSVGYETLLETLKLETKDITIFLEPSVHELREAVISAGSSKLQGENVLHVEKVSLANHPEMLGISLSQKLSEVPGVNNYSTGVGIGKPVIRGFSGNRIAVFSQGVRVENQQWGDEHGLGLDENGYGEVEIIKGPASLLYGSDALGGVLYFTDERYALENHAEGVLSSVYYTNTDGWRNTGSFKLSKGHFHWNLFGGYTTHEDYADGNSAIVDNSRFRTGDLKTTIAYTGNKLISSLKYGFLKEQYGLAEGMDSLHHRDGERKPALPYQGLTTHMFGLENIFFLGSESKLKVDMGYIFNSRKEFEEHEHENEIEEGENEAALAMNLSTLSYNIKWYTPKWKKRWNFIVGSQGMFQTNMNHGAEVLIPDAATTDMGFFATSDFYYTQKSYWQAGLRVDGRFINGQEYGTLDEDSYFPAFSKNYAAFNFSTGIYQQVTTAFSLRANFASGYRAPNMFELLSNGAHEGANRYEIGNIDLETENCYQMDVSLHYQIKHLELFADPYINYIKHYIYLDPSGEIKNDLPVYDYKQTDAYLYGGEAGFHFHPHPLDWLHINVSYSNTFGQDSHQEALPLMPSPKINATIKADFQSKKFIKHFFVYLQNQYAFDQKRIAEYETPTGAYNLVNTGCGFECKWKKQRVLFSISADNIFNKVYYDHLSRYKQEGIYNIGRNISFRLSIPFQWEIAQHVTEK